MKKKIVALAALACLIVAMALPAGATSQTVCETKTVTTVYGDFEIEETLIVYNNLRSSSRTASKTATCRQNGSVVAEATLTATFGYDGSSAWVGNASGSHTTYSGWSYSGEKVSKVGSTATLTASVSKSGVVKSISVSMTCSPSGSIS